MSKILSFLLFLLCIILSVKVLVTKQHNKIKTDLPEEYLEISKDSLKPTVLQGWINKNGTLVIRFNNKQKLTK